MPTSLLYHAIGVRGYEYSSTAYVAGQVWFMVGQPHGKLCCPLCGSHEVTRRGEVAQTFRTVPVVGKAVWLTVGVARVGCEACQIVRQE